VSGGEGTAVVKSPWADVAEDPSAHSGPVSHGHVFYLPAGASVHFEAGEGGDLSIMKCMCSPRIF
jgi:hypothetical protein